MIFSVEICFTEVHIILCNNTYFFCQEHWIYTKDVTKLKLMHQTSVDGVDDMVCHGNIS